VGLGRAEYEIDEKFASWLRTCFLSTGKGYRPLSVAPVAAPERLNRHLSGGLIARSCIMVFQRPRTNKNNQEA
ncbi:MAG: hypothetical protein L3K26_08690, partial [Candidatus Hydrogenedentes bacterium]|nr:hypothetical protein [Candidatus Hydrogenedentota bacterium]